VIASAVRPYPFDLTTLAKGSVIGVEDCERVSGVKRGSPLFALGLLRVQDLLARQWLAEIGEVITTRAHNDTVLILSDDDACGENERRSRGHIQGLRRDLARQSGVDRSKLSTPELLEAHERSLVRRSAFLAAGSAAYRQARLAPATRRTPGLG